jgi:hypothetical protein
MDWQLIMDHWLRNITVKYWASELVQHGIFLISPFTEVTLHEYEEFQVPTLD